MELQDITKDKLQAIYQKLFSLHYLNCNLGDKLGVIALTFAQAVCLLIIVRIIAIICSIKYDD